MTTLFAYGTLLFPEVLRAVTGRVLRPRAARLEGYRRRAVIGEIFPAMVEGGDGDVVAGVVYRGLLDGDWARLDRFEGELYQRRRVTVWRDKSPPAGGAKEVAGDAGVAAFTYVLDAGWSHRLARSPWDPEAFARDHLERFVTRLVGQLDPRAIE